MVGNAFSAGSRELRKGDRGVWGRNSADSGPRQPAGRRWAVVRVEGEQIQPCWWWVDDPVGHVMTTHSRQTCTRRTQLDRQEALFALSSQLSCPPLAHECICRRGYAFGCRWTQSPPPYERVRIMACFTGGWREGKIEECLCSTISSFVMMPF